MQRYRRYSDRDTHFGPYLTYSAPDTFTRTAIVLDSGDSDEHPGCHLLLAVLGHTLIIELPSIIKPWQNPTETWDRHSREFGFSYHDGFLQVFLGPQTHDSTTTRSWSRFLPWTQWRHVRFSLYGLEGEHVWTQFDRDSRVGSHKFDELRAAEKACPKATFAFVDYDGQRLQATTRIHEREWRFGTGWFRWLSLFRRARVSRSLDIEFSAEVGPDKGSWKGGTLGHGIEMLPGELHEAAFRRYCAQEQRAKAGRFSLQFVGAAPVLA